jgi:hypothetical protein
MSMKKSSDAIKNQAHDLPVCSAVTQPLRHRVARMKLKTHKLCHVLNAEFSLLAESPASEFHVLTFQNTPSIIP